MIYQPKFELAYERRVDYPPPPDIRALGQLYILRIRPYREAVVLFDLDDVESIAKALEDMAVAVRKL